MNRRRTLMLVIGTVAVVTAFFAWPRRPVSTRQQVEQRCVQLMRAAEERDVGQMMAFVSSDFRGVDGTSREDLRGLLIRELLHPSWVRIFMADLVVDVPGKDRATARAKFVFGRSEAASLRDLAKDSVMSAWALEADFAQEKGEWRVTSERHRALAPDELLAPP